MQNKLNRKRRKERKDIQIKLKEQRANFVLLCVLCVFCGSISAYSEDAELNAKLEQRITEYKAETVAVYYEAPGSPVYSYNPDVVMHAASTMKVPVMMEVFHQVETGKLNMDQKILVKNEFASIVDGSPFSLTKEDDSEQELYSHLGESMTLSSLLQRMINSSSNFATNMIIQIVDARTVMELMKRIGAKDMTVLRGVEDIKAYDAGKNNTTSARALAQCLKSILTSDVFSPQSQQQMLAILQSQKFQEIGGALRKIDPQLQIASKDGYITEIHHDAAIVRDKAGKNTILVILTRGVKDDKAGEAMVGVLATDVWTHFHP